MAGEAARSTITKLMHFFWQFVATSLPYKRTKPPPPSRIYKFSFTLWEMELLSWILTMRVSWN